MAYILGKKEMRNGACITDVTIEDKMEMNGQRDSLRRPKLIYFNWILTILLLLALVKGVMSSHILFLIATVIALLVNFPNPKDQTDRIKAHAPNATYMVITIIAAGIFLGIFRETKMVDELVIAVVNIMPAFLGPYLHIVLGIFAAPLGMILGPDPYVYGLTELIVGVTTAHGIDPVSVVKAMVMGECSGWSISPVVSSLYLGLGLAGVELKDHIKNAFFWVWGITVLMLVFALFTGGI
jgi:CitMHS family citrate-Mg2+:H+ or citrate-Ca2+:H+ symporter